MRYVRTNNPVSTYAVHICCTYMLYIYAVHILNNRHEYGTAEETLELLKPCNKGTRMNCWEAFYMQAFHQHKILIN